MKNLILMSILLLGVVACHNLTQKPEQTDAPVELVELTLHVTGMTCGGCENAVIGALEEIDGIDTATASYVDEQVSVMYDPQKTSAEAITEIIKNTGYTVVSTLETEPE